MTKDIEFEFNDVTKLNRLFADASALTSLAVRGIVAKAALNIKTDARKMATGIGFASRYPLSITYDLKSTATGAEAEIGPDKSLGGLQGALGNILEYGAPAKNTSPHPHMLPATEKELPRFQAAIEAASAKPLGG